MGDDHLVIGYTYHMKNSEHNANSWAYHKFCTKPWSL